MEFNEIRSKVLKILQKESEKAMELEKVAGTQA